MRNKVHQRSASRGLRAVMLMLAFVLALAACGSASTSVVADADESETNESTEVEEEDSQAEQAGQSEAGQSEDERPFQEVITSVHPAGSITIDAIGGINVDLPQEVRQIAGGGCVCLLYTSDAADE